MLALRSRAPVRVIARELNGEATRRGRGSHQKQAWGLDVTNADSESYVLHCLIWNDRRLETVQTVQRHSDEGKGVCLQAGKRGRCCFLSAGG